MKERNFTKEELVELLLHPSPRELRERRWRKSLLPATIMSKNPLKKSSGAFAII